MVTSVVSCALRIVKHALIALTARPVPMDGSTIQQQTLAKSVANSAQYAQMQQPALFAAADTF